MIHLGAVALLLLTAAGAQAQTALERIRETGKAVLGVAGEAPYGYIDGGKATGEAPEIAKAVLGRIRPGIEIEAVEVPFGELIPALNAGRFDIAAAGMFITPERCAQVVFSNPTYVVGEAFAVKTGNPKKLDSYVAVSNTPDARVGLIAGTVEYNYALVTGIPAARAPLYRNFAQALEALKAGEVDAIGLTSLTARGMAAGDPDLAATEQFYPVLDGEEVKGYGAFAFRPEDEALAEAFDRELADFLGSEAHLALVAPFGFTSDMLPDKTAEQLCKGGSG